MILQDFLDAKRRESVDTLIRSEEKFSDQKRKNNAYLTPDVEWEKFKEKVVSTLLAAGNDGVIAQLRNQRLRNSSGLLLGASGNRPLSKEELQFAQVVSFAITLIHFPSRLFYFSISYDLSHDFGCFAAG